MGLCRTKPWRTKVPSQSHGNRRSAYCVTLYRSYNRSLLNCESKAWQRVLHQMAKGTGKRLPELPDRVEPLAVHQTVLAAEQPVLLAALREAFERLLSWRCSNNN